MLDCCSSEAADTIAYYMRLVGHIVTSKVDERRMLSTSFSAEILTQFVCIYLLAHEHVVASVMPLHTDSNGRN